MASISIYASMNAAPSFRCSTVHQAGRAAASSLGTAQETTHVRPSNFEVHRYQSPLPVTKNEKQDLAEQEPPSTKFVDERWKNGTWDLNMFIKRGRMDWHSVISAEANRRRFLELYPEAATNQEPVLFRSSIIPWWAWITHSHLPEAELLNGRAAMVGFFMSYLVDGLTGIDVVGQTGNFVCKAAVFATVIGVVLFRKKDDFEKLQKLADEATFYDKQWQSSWKDQTGAAD
ncbi:OLC1v1027077C1 [Oldenlandia corymbosa var. corymbosa]|uniref:OLC1v1027077C1 n=1 Tax=Oldenlandia corymbosa var. corymbosa TaxID=529605 RepID=A0AAV1C9U5_OLDCO|nr:OLC1v1027077C1 [Oldenlandia corymbosa var. corymbosa]